VSSGAITNTPARIADVRVNTGVAASASQTGTTLWDPAAGKKFVIVEIMVSCTTAGAITIFDGTDNSAGRVVAGSFAANGGCERVYNISFPFVSSAANNILKYTTDTFVGKISVGGFEI
jgi:hypothetical protein